MDNGIVYNLLQMQPEDSQAKIELLGKYDPNGELNIRDPLFVNIIICIYLCIIIYISYIYISLYMLYIVIYCFILYIVYIHIFFYILFNTFFLIVG